MTARAVFLVGFMGSGKSSVGKELARRLNWDFVDLDSRIEIREGHTIPELFRDRGEDGFRLAETNALRDLTESLACNTVVALGGGTFAQRENRALLQSWRSVFLEAPLDELWRRCVEHDKDRPLRKDRIEFTRLYQHRLPFYRQAAITVVTTGKDPASLCDEIERKLQSWGRAVDAGSSQIPSANSESGEIS
jgi:shikimate kinase